MNHVTIVAAIVAGVLLLYYVIDWLKSLTALQRHMWVSETLLSLARGAEQALGRSQGAAKLEWVQKAAKERGIPCTDQDIEAATWIVNYLDGAKWTEDATKVEEVPDGRR